MNNGNPHSETISRKVGIIQHYVPNYRAPFFDQLAKKCPKGCEVFAGEAQRNTGLKTSRSLSTGNLYLTKNIHIGHIERDIWYLCWQRDVLKWLKEWNPDILIMQAFPRILSNWLAIRYMHHRSRPILGWGLGELPQFRSGPNAVNQFRSTLLSRLVQACDGIISYSTKGADDYVRLGVPIERVFIAYNATDTSRANSLRTKMEMEPDIIANWQTQTLGNHNPVILFVGRLLPQKRVSDLIYACAQINDPCQLIIIGDGPEKSKLESLANEFLPSTQFLGHQTGEELGFAFMSASVFVLPGSGGLTIQEAMAYGKPVIVADGDGTQYDLVNPGKNGYLIASGNIQGLVNVLEEILKYDCLREMMGNESIKLIREKINLTQMVKSFVRACNTITLKNPK